MGRIASPRALPGAARLFSTDGSAAWAAMGQDRDARVAGPLFIKEIIISLP